MLMTSYFVSFFFYTSVSFASFLPVGRFDELRECAS